MKNTSNQAEAPISKTALIHKEIKLEAVQAGDELERRIEKAIGGGWEAGCSVCDAARVFLFRSTRVLLRCKDGVLTTQDSEEILNRLEELLPAAVNCITAIANATKVKNGEAKKLHSFSQNLLARMEIVKFYRSSDIESVSLDWRKTFQNLLKDLAGKITTGSLQPAHA